MQLVTEIEGFFTESLHDLLVDQFDVLSIGVDLWWAFLEFGKVIGRHVLYVHIRLVDLLLLAPVQSLAQEWVHS